MGIATLVAHVCTTLRLPLRAIQQYLRDLHGLRVSVGELVDLLHRVAAQGAPTVEQIRAQAQSRRVVHGDEISWREAGRNGYVWTLATREGERYFAYAHSRGRARRHARRVASSR